MCYTNENMYIDYMMYNYFTPKKLFKMKIGKKFNTFTFKEYFSYIENHKKYTDFNTLGLYRSLLENVKLTLEQKIEVREYAHTFFKKFFDFLQIKDPNTFIVVSNLGIGLENKRVAKTWEEVEKNQQKILKEKKIKHRNFGTYSRSSNWGHMKTRTVFESGMTFVSDKHNKSTAQKKSEMQEVEKRNLKNTIRKELEELYTTE